MTDNRAVSPVTGMVAMLFITVLLALAVTTGVFDLHLGAGLRLAAALLIGLGGPLAVVYAAHRVVAWHTHGATTDRAVSPVIGVIFMVAITVILAAVAGMFVFDLGQAKADSTPSVSFAYEYGGQGTLTVSHAGGQTVDGDSLTIKADGVQTAAQFASEQVRAGDSVSVNVSSGDTVVVLYEQDGSSRILSQYEVP